MNRIKTTVVRDEFGSIINRVAFGKEHFVLQRRNKDLAAIIPMEEFHLLNEYISKLEDRIDAKESVRVMKRLPELVPFGQIDWTRKQSDVQDHVHARSTAHSGKPARTGPIRHPRQDRHAGRKSATR